MPTDPTIWQGKLDLVYRYHQGATQVSHAFAQAPLKIQRPFYPEGPSICHSVILHTAGGIVGGDRLDQNVRLYPQTHALITSAAASKVYRSEGKISQQTVNIQLEANAYLEWLPQEGIMFNGARHRQQIRVDLRPDAAFLGWEITRMGRTARGERFEQGEMRSHLEIWQDQQPLWIDRQHLQGSADLLHSHNGLAGNAVIATLIYIGKPIPAAIVAQARHCWQSGNYTGESGVTQTLKDGLLCRYRGSSSQEARQWFCEIWQMLRQECIQRPTVQPRVWLL